MNNHRGSCDAPDGFRPAYLALPRGTISERARRAVESLADCRACPRDCGANRLEGKWGACKTGRHALVNSCFPHMGEEDCLRGWNGSGTIFFSHCNLRCVFCQNFDISQGIKPGASLRGTPPEEIAGMLLTLQANGCHNINLVTPEHVVPQALEALAQAVERGLALPIVYNTSAYDSVDSLRLFDGIVDIYMPDLKFASSEMGHKYLKAEDYPEAAFRAVKEMHEQVGPLVLGEDGLAQRGVLIRHLVMPGMLDNTRQILEWIAHELGPNSYVNLMAQYRPSGNVSGVRFSEINRQVTQNEFSTSVRVAKELGLRLDERRR